MVEALAAFAAAAAVFWIVGGVVLRGLGLVTVASGVLVVSQGEVWGILVMMVGIAAWLAGHWHFALRHRFWKSALAEAIVIGI